MLGCDLPIEQPGAIAYNELIISGWAVSPTGISGVVVQIDSREFQASYGLDTPWVVESMPEMPGAREAGYYLRLDTAEWPHGIRSVNVAAIDGEDRRTEIAGEVEVVPYQSPLYTVEDNRTAQAEGIPTMWLEEPRIVEGPCEVAIPVEVSGWAYAKAGIDSVVILIDGRDRHDALHPSSRVDLLPDYGPEVAGASGFSLSLSKAELSPGSHTLSVVAIASDGRAVGVGGSLLCRPESAPLSVPPEGEPMKVEWLERRTAPRRREDEPGTWEKRALRAEADAAASRIEANLAQLHQKGALKMLRDAEERLRKPSTRRLPPAPQAPGDASEPPEGGGHPETSTRDEPGKIG